MRLPGDHLPEPSTERERLLLKADLGLLTVAELLRQHWTNHAAALGLSNAQITVLLALAPGEPEPMRSLAARLDSDASNLSALVDRLEHRGVVQRRSAEGDRRVKALVLTPAGEKLRADFWSGLLADPGPLAPLDEAQLNTLIEVLAALGALTE